MQSTATIHPLILLKELEETCKERIATSIPSASSTNNINQRGVGFRIDGFRLVVKTRYVNEILDSSFRESISRVPAAKSWFLGLISLRGQPLPVIDFKEYLSNEATPVNHTNRLLVINHKNMSTGLVVEEIFGLKQIPENIDTDDSDYPTSIVKLINGTFSDNNNTWGELSIDKLTDDPEFLNAAIG